ncbi:MAG TPA: PDZ domain-containing protein, partial [Longimicrobiales bacterium]|nr:PDZ domain-containing protein [Longimicrobiales bacterium]
LADRPRPVGARPRPVGARPRALRALRIAALAASFCALAAPASGQARGRDEARGRATDQRAITSRDDGRGWFGFSLGLERSSLAGLRTSETLRVSSVVPGSPAFRGGLRQGDVILQLGGRSATGRWLERAVSGIAPGDTLRVRVRRSGRERDLTLIAAQRPAAIRVVQGAGDGRLFLADSLQLRAQVILDSIRANVREVHLAVVYGEANAPATIVIRDGAGEERRLRVAGEGAEVVLRDLRAAIERQRSTTPARVHIEVEADADEVRRALVERERIRRSSVRSEPRVFLSEDSVHVWVPRPARGYGVSMAAWSIGAAGAEFTPLVEGMRKYFGLDAGLLVIRVGPGTPAARAGLVAGDIVTGVDGRRTRDVRELAEALTRAGEDGLSLRIVRRGASTVVRIPGP